jgi:hypothetical protein
MAQVYSIWILGLVWGRDHPEEFRSKQLSPALYAVYSLDNVSLRKQSAYSDSIAYDAVLKKLRAVKLV